MSPDNANQDVANQPLVARLHDFVGGLTAIGRENSQEFFSPDADYRGSGAIVRGRENVIAEIDADLGRRAAATVVSTRQIGEFTLVDSAFDSADGRGWFTELWGPGASASELTIASSRMRFGQTDQAFTALSATTPNVIGAGVNDDVVQQASADLQSQFKEFRSAFNSGNSQGVTALFTENSDAIVAFSFLQGRAQILSGPSELTAKAERMTTGTAVATAFTARRPATADPTSKALGALFVGGQPKTVRFLSENVAVVDGTAEIAGIPRAHGFSPSEMSGVYTNFWSKSGNAWLCAATRPWF